MELDDALKEIDRLKGELGKFEGIDPTQVKANQQTLSEQLNTTKSTLDSYKQSSEARIKDLEGQLTQRDIRSQFVNSYTGAKGLPEYGDVLFNALAGNFELKDGKVVDKTSQKPVEEAISDYRTKYPAMFAAEGDGSGSGSTGSTGQTETTGTKVVKAQNGIIQGVSPTELRSSKLEA